MKLLTLELWQNLQNPKELSLIFPMTVKRRWIRWGCNALLILGGFACVFSYISFSLSFFLRDFVVILLRVLFFTLLLTTFSGWIFGVSFALNTARRTHKFQVAQSLALLQVTPDGASENILMLSLLYIRQTRGFIFIWNRVKNVVQIIALFGLVNAIVNRDEFFLQLITSAQTLCLFLIFAFDFAQSALLGCLLGIWQGMRKDNVAFKLASVLFLFLALKFIAVVVTVISYWMLSLLFGASLLELSPLVQLVVWVDLVVVYGLTHEAFLRILWQRIHHLEH
jgi:hypothetical protein